MPESAGMTNSKDVLVVFRPLASLANGVKEWVKEPNDDWTERRKVDSRNNELIVAMKPV